MNAEFIHLPEMMDVLLRRPLDHHIASELFDVVWNAGPRQMKQNWSDLNPEIALDMLS